MHILYVGIDIFSYFLKFLPTVEKYQVFFPNTNNLNIYLTHWSDKKQMLSLRTRVKFREMVMMECLNPPQIFRTGA